MARDVAFGRALMACFGVLILAAGNYSVFSFVSVLAVPGDGSADGVGTVRAFGYFWIAAFTAAALFLCARGSYGAGILTVVSTLPTAYVAAVAIPLAGYALTYIKPNSPEFRAACKSAGVHFAAAPAAPVRSIAYDGAPDDTVQEFNYFELGANGRVSSRSIRNPPYPPQIAFIERKTTERLPDGTQSAKIVRFPRDGLPQRAVALTADVLVSYKYTTGESELSKASSQQGLVGYELTVVDQRDQRELARLRYFTELTNNRVCGPTGNGVLDTRKFVLNAVGM